VKKAAAFLSAYQHAVFRDKVVNSVVDLQKLRGDPTVKEAAIASMVSEIVQMHEHTVSTLAPALNESLMHHCLSKYSKVTGNLAWVRTRYQYEEKHRRAADRARTMLSNV
jgi:hypothetical protein